MLQYRLEGTMFRTLLRLIVVMVVLVAGAMFFLGYRLSDFGDRGGVKREEPVVGTGGRLPQVDTTKARETGAAIGEKVAAGANQAERALANASLTARIKSKMALDDSVKAADINVDTAGGVVTLTGTVRSKAERVRAVQLARETHGVTSVTDRLTIR
jgi:BON domain-containing protein